MGCFCLRSQAHRSIFSSGHDRESSERGVHRIASAGHTGGGVPGLLGETTVHHPLTGVTYTLGGTIEANAASRADSWPRIIDFLQAGLWPRGRKARQ
jgi:hypothetical protein